MINYDFKFSNFFFPKTKEETTVIFPSTFIKFGCKYLLIYSVNDSYSEKKLYTKEEINNYLIYNKSTNFKEVKYLFMK